MTEVKLSGKNQVVIPKEAREALSVKPGDTLLMIPKDDKVVIMVKPKAFADALAGTGRGLYGQPDRYLKRERRSWERRSSRPSRNTK